MRRWCLDKRKHQIIRINDQASCVVRAKPITVSSDSFGRLIDLNTEDLEFGLASFAEALGDMRC